LRGRKPEDLDRLLTEGVRKVDTGKPIIYFPCECEAVEYAIKNANPNSVITVLTDNIKKVTECIRQHQKEHNLFLQKAV